MNRGLKLENFFLKIFKFSILASMSIALLATLISIGLSAYLSLKAPPSVVTPQPPPATNVSTAEFRDSIIKSPIAPQVAKPDESSLDMTTVTSSLKYNEDVTILYRCTIDFSKAVNAKVESNDSTVVSQQLESLRKQIEMLADAQPTRGSPWVKSVVEFTCRALKDPTIVAARKSDSINKVFESAINFHLTAWDRRQQARDEFTQHESERYKQDLRNAEFERERSRSSAVYAITAAGIAFGVFMALAFYLILAKIENNLRGLSPRNDRLEVEA